MEPRCINVKWGVNIWLDGFPNPTIQNPEHHLERSMPALPAKHKYTTQAAIRKSGLEADYLIGAEFRADPASNTLTIRVPVGGTVPEPHPRYEGFSEELARRVFTDLVVAAYSGFESVAALGTGILEFNCIGVHIVNMSWSSVYSQLALQILPLLQFSTGALENEDVLLRLATADSLSLTESHVDLIPNLVPALRDPDAEVRARAAGLLGNIKNILAVPDLIAALSKESPAVSEIARALVKIGDKRAVEPLIDVLRNEGIPATAKTGVPQALGEFGDSRAVIPLLEQLAKVKNDQPADEVLGWADQTYSDFILISLGKLGDVRAVPALVDVAENSTWWRLQGKAAHALGQIGDPTALPVLVNLLEHSERSVRRESAEALGQIGDQRAVPSLLSLIQIEKDELAKYEVAEALGNLRDDSTWTPLFKLLKKVLGDDNGIAKALVRIDPERSMKELPKLLSRKDSKLRLAILEALSETGKSDATRLLLRALKTEPSKSRRRILYRLRELRDKAAVPNLLKLAQNEKEERVIRCEALKTLGAMQAKEAVADVMKLVDNEDAAIAGIAIEALGEIGDPVAIPKLIEKLYDDRLGSYYLSYCVYYWAELALRRFDTPEAKAAIEEAYWFRQSRANSKR